MHFDIKIYRKERSPMLCVINILHGQNLLSTLHQSSSQLFTAVLLVHK